MNVKKTALATAIALTMAGGSAWAETTTVKGQFIADKIVVDGDNTVNFALLGLNKDGEVDRLGEKQGSTIIAVVNTIKGTIQGGGDRPNEPGEGYFASDVRYFALNQGVGRVSIYYPNEIAGSADTEDTVSVQLLEKDSDGKFQDIGQDVEKTITIKAGTSAPTMLTLTEFERAPADPLNDVLGSEKTTATGMGLPGIMTAGYEGAQIRVVGNNRAVNNVTLKVIDSKSPDAPIYTNTRRMVLGEALFTLGSKIKTAGTYHMIAELVSESEDDVPVTSVRMNSQDTLTVWPTRKPASLKLSLDKERITNPGAEVFDSNGMCKEDFPANQVCQGTKITLKLLDEYGNETSLTDMADDFTVVVGDNKNDNKVVKDLKFKIPAGSSMAKPIEGGDWILGNQTGEILRTEATSLLAKVVSGGSGIADSALVPLKVVDKSLSAKATPDFERSQKAGTESKAFFVKVVNRVGTTLDESPGNNVTIKTQSEELTATRYSDGSTEGFFKKATSGDDADKYLLSAGNFAQVWATGSRITPAAAHEVKMLSASGDEVTAINPIFDPEQQEYIVSIPETTIKMYDAYGNAITENMGDFLVNKPASAKALRSFGADVLQGGFSSGEIQVVYDPETFSGEDIITIKFNKAALKEVSLQVKTVIPPPVREGLGSIKSYIETTDIPVNSEVALTVETLDKQGKLFNGETTVTITFDEGEPGEEGEELNIITPKVIELIRGSVDDSLTEAVCDDIPRGEFVVGSGCNLSKIRLADCLENGYIYTEDDGCQKQEESIVASGGRLIFTGRKLFVVEAGPRVGKFGLTFKDANRPDEIKDARTFKVTNEIVVEPAKTEEECLGEGNLWMDEDKACKPMPDRSTGGAFVIGADGSQKSSNVRITGGTSIEGGDIAGSGAAANLSDTPEIRFVGNIKFDPDHEGKKVDIIAVALYQPNPFLTGIGGGTYFSLQEGGIAVYWNLTDVADIESFYDDKHTIVKDEPKVVEIFNGKFKNPPFVASTLDVWLGYRLTSGSDKGTIIFNPQSIQVTLLP